MKQIVFEDMYCWSVFNDQRQIDFNGHLWVRREGNVLIDPVPMSENDLRQLDRLGGAALIVLTNADHEREAAFFRERTGADVVVHSEDADALSVPVDRMVEDGEEIVPGLECIHLRYGKSPGELALYWPERKLVLAGDLVVGAPLGRVSLLMDEKLADPPRAALELRKVLARPFEALLVGDGHSIMHGAREEVLACLERRSDVYINKVNVKDVPWVDAMNRPGHQWQSKDLDPLVGARHLGYQLVRLPQGQSICPLHFHHFGEEMFYALKGDCTLRTPRGDWPVSEGDIIAFPPGSSGAHTFINERERECVLLALGQKLAHDVCEYPNSKKINVFAKADTGDNIYRQGDCVGYWEGE